MTKRSTPHTTLITDIITSADDQVRNASLHGVCRNASLKELLELTAQLEPFWRRSDNLYHRVRAMFFLSAIHRYYIPARLPRRNPVRIPYDSYCHLLGRRFVESIDLLLSSQHANGPAIGLSSALAQAYHELGFQTLANQVRRSVRTVSGNQWMFRVGHPADHPLRIRPELAERTGSEAAYPILREETSVRMDFSHSGWSDIFFLGMDYPEGARVINASINLGVRGRDAAPRPPIETYLRLLDTPILRLVSVDLQAYADVTTVAEVFDFARDYLGLLKGAVIASGIVPPGMEGCGASISDVLERVVGPGRGLEIASRVNDIPKGSRLAVSTNLLGSLISLAMRATGQVKALTGPLSEPDRRVIAARAILGEWIGGSGGGWQDSGGVWPGIKAIVGRRAVPGDTEFGISRGCLLPDHQVFTSKEISPSTREKLQQSLVLVHGGMAQNVGPILEMVTEKYLLRTPDEWTARLKAMELMERIAGQLRAGDIRGLGQSTTDNFFGPLQTIVPWCTNLYTNSLVEQSRKAFGDDFWGFWMLGGMAGGGMGFMFAPGRADHARDWLAQTMQVTKDRLQHALPFAMNPVVYEFEINDRGTCAELLASDRARMPHAYYALMVPQWLRSESRALSPQTRHELETIGSAIRDVGGVDAYRGIIENILPHVPQDESEDRSLDGLLTQHGFDRAQHEQIRHELRTGRIGLAQNRLSRNTTIEDVAADDIDDVRDQVDRSVREQGEAAIARGEVAVMTLAAGVGSRWTEGAGVVKGLHPFARFGGQHRTFLEVHLAKSHKTGAGMDEFPPHIITTGYLTHGPITATLQGNDNYGYLGDVIVSRGMSVGLRTIPMTRDLHFAWEELPQQVLDEQKQKVRASLRSALLQWARSAGEGNDYTDNLPLQCLHPVGHWYEFPNLLRNGTLERLIDDHPRVKYLMLHNVDTLGANVDPGLLGLHIQNGDCLSFEVMDRRLEDRGGGLAKVNGRLRLLEGLAMPREADEFRLAYYNSMTTWIDIDQLLDVFGLTRCHLPRRDLVDDAVRRVAMRMPTYITIKEVKKRWGQGQEDIFPVTQFEKLWGDMTSLPEVSCGFLLVSMERGQQMKQQAQLDGWLRDGSAAYVDQLCAW